ncbi:MAG: SBBP repeat-containing protein [Sphingobacteriaceae bacterium]|nr:SBBP repeat-containing protein [Sphingobacteriaceae bacterium]
MYNLTSAGNYEIFVSKLASIGNFIWAKQMGGANQDQSYSISLDSKRNVYTTGYFQSLVADFDPGPSTFTLTPGTSQGGHLSMLDYNGNFVWAALLGSIGFCVYTAPYDCIYLTGSFDGVRDFDPGPGSTTLTANTNDLYVHKMCNKFHCQ